MNQKTLFIATAGVLVVAFFVVSMLFQKNKTATENTAVEHNQSVLERTGAPLKGPADARVTIVEFFDPACGTCRDFYPLLQRLIDQYPGQVRVMLRYAPLHQGSDQVVKILEAAHQQGQFWQALELLFNNQQHWVINHVSQPMRALNMVNSLQLDQEKLALDMGRSDVTRIVEKDVRDGQTLHVRATPEFFVNGKPMPSFGYAQLSQLVKEAVVDAYPL